MTSNDSIERRTILKTIGAATGAGALAGCGDEEVDEDLGERVPEIVYAWYTFDDESYAEIAPDNIRDMGFDVSVSSGDFATITDRARNDTREQHIMQYGHGPSPSRLDPDEFVYDYGAQYAGPGGEPNNSNYANCEYTYHAAQQRVAPDEETRREHVNRAEEIKSQDIGVIPTLTYVGGGVCRDDLIDWNAISAGGMTNRNAWYQIYSEPNEGNEIHASMGGDATRTLNWPTTGAVGALQPISQTCHSCLVEYNEDLELQGVVAEDWETTNEGLTLTFNLRDGQFHNGDEITADDVKFTFEQTQRHLDYYPLATELPIDSIDVIDDKTIEFNWTRPNPTFVTTVASLWGIMHQDSWEDLGAHEDPDAYQPDVSEGEFIGSGPFRVTGFDAGQQMRFEPFSDSPYHPEPSIDSLIWTAYEETEAAVSAFIEGTVTNVTNADLAAAHRAEAQLDEEQVLVAFEEMHTPRLLMPQHSYPPGQFWEFRQAVGMAINRQEMSAVAFDGIAAPMLELTMFNENHPWHPEDADLHTFTEDPTGDVDGAIEVLEEAGWERDTNGDWHYPPDKDLTPQWPEGEGPSPEDFPCITDDGEYNDDYEPENGS